MELDETMPGDYRRLKYVSKRWKCGAPHNPLVEIYLMEDVTALSAPIFCFRKRISAVIAGAEGILLPSRLVTAVFSSIGLPDRPITIQFFLANYQTVIQFGIYEKRQTKWI
ncbi:hypothetical protein EHQ96_04060 [Leptospira levettii]|uniref:hypothetical protein n=1 Tax=Leptospira levettii TaxID=2023178 RepID=UPI001084710D|nr:hypothetical protein [Leptospira levettii]TGM68727.1 hypothetical protein EHQ96_04060 [Leptospira levettii]